MTTAVRTALDTAQSVVIFCPSCGRRYTLDQAVVDDASIRVLCGVCESLFRLGDVRQETARPASLRDQAHGTVVVAHESPSVCATVGRVLEEAGFQARYVHDGARAIAAFDPTLPDRPVALVVDVGIPEVMAFQVASVLKGRPDSSHVPVVLLASVFERTRYKRRPTTLHGADAYVELHHVPDRLAPLLGDLLSREGMPGMRPHLPVERAVADSLRPMPAGGDLADAAAAKAVARRLVSDVALYHEASMVRGLAHGRALEDPEVAAALLEAQGIFRAQVGSSHHAVFEEALKELLAGLANVARQD